MKPDEKPLTKPRIVSIQSQVVYGCAGNSAAIPLLQALGCTTYAIPTVVLSNTPRYSSTAGIDVHANLVGELLNCLLERVPARQLDAIVTGYIRDPDTVAVVAQFIDWVRGENPAVVVVCDPVMGDTDLDFFISDKAARAVRDQLVPRATVCTPNLFEAHFITGLSGDDLVSIGRALLEAGPEIALVSGVGLGAASAEVETFAFFDARRLSVKTPKLDFRPTGTGDLLAAAFGYRLLMSGEVTPSLEGAVRTVYNLMQQAMNAGVMELDPASIREITHHPDNTQVRLIRYR